MELLFSLALGIGLSAATGFRIFVPALLASGASILGWISPGEEFQWLATWPAFAVFATASLVEVGAYYVPWIDNALDTIAVPGSVLAGGLIATSFIEVDSPMLQWIIGMMAGGSTAGVVQTGTALLRGASTATTGGLANPVVSTSENVAALTVSAASILVPILGLLLTLTIGWLLWRGWRRLRRQPRQRLDTAP